MSARRPLRVVAISDTHGFHDSVEIPDGDVLIHAGDLTTYGKLEEVRTFNAFLAELPHRHKVVIAGNHDWCFQREGHHARALLHAAIYLEDEAVEIEGWRFYGSPWQPEFMDWAFNLPRGAKLREKWDRIPQDTDVLVTHGPPLGHGDETFDGHPVGCEELALAVERVRPRLHVFGHIHEGAGIERDAHTVFANASSLDVYYRPVNAALELQLR